MNQELKGIIPALSRGNYDRAKSLAINSLKKDTTKKDEMFCKSTLELFERQENSIPNELKKFIKDTNNDFNIDRYYLTERECAIYEEIYKMSKVSEKLNEMGLNYLNSTLLHGESGTGKTAFTRYLAEELELPYLYVNISNLIDSLLGQTSKNIDKIFEYVSDRKCVLVLDEIDSIASERGDGDLGEMSRITIGLMQGLDSINNNTIVIAATNRLDILDKAVIRRFNNIHEVERLRVREVEELTNKFLNNIELDNKSKNKNNIKKQIISKRINKQSEIVSSIISKIAEILKEEK